MKWRVGDWEKTTMIIKSYAGKKTRIKDANSNIR